MKWKSKDKPRHRVVFTCHAPEAKCVCVAGTFNGWKPDDLPMQRGPNGTWETALYVAPGHYEYRFVVDGEWRDDPRAGERVPNEFGSENCVLKVKGGENP